MTLKTLLNLRIRTYLSLTIILLLTGCASGVNMLPTLSKEITPNKKQGVVVVRVINASAYPLPFNQLTITPKNLNESKEVKPSRLQALTISTTRNTIFSSPVKAGSYSLNSLRAFHIRGDYWYSRWAGTDAQFGTFNVEPGKTTDLGIIIYYPKPQEDKYLNTVLRQPSIKLGDTLHDYFPFYDFSPEQLLTWTEDEYQEERDTLFSSVAQNPVTFNTKYLAPDNSVYFIGKLGVILKRTAAHEWEIDAIDTNYDLFAITQNEHGDIAIGGDEGVVFYKPVNGEWQDISIDNSHHIEELHFTKNGYLELVSRTDTNAYVMHKPITNYSEKWKTIISYNSLQGWQGSNGKILSSIRKKEKSNKPKIKRILSVAVNRDNDIKTVTISQQSTRSEFVFSSGKKTTYEFNPEDWFISEFKNNTDVAIDTQINAGAVKMGIEFAGFWSLNGKPTYYKQDLVTDQWVKIASSLKSCKEGYKVSGKYCVAINNSNTRIKINNKSFNFTSTPWFKNNNEGTAIVSFSDYNFWTGNRSSETAIMNTVDGGKSWNKTEYVLPNEFCTQLVSDVKESMLLSCDGVSSDFYESTDSGKTWTQVREHENY